MDNHGFRYYDASIGRYISNDPIGYEGGFNRYVHCTNDPVNKFDPLGLADVEEDDDDTTYISSEPVKREKRVYITPEGFAGINRDKKTRIQIGKLVTENDIEYIDTPDGNRMAYKDFRDYIKSGDYLGLSGAKNIDDIYDSGYYERKNNVKHIIEGYVNEGAKSQLDATIKKWSDKRYVFREAFSGQILTNPNGNNRTPGFDQSRTWIVPRSYDIGLNNFGLDNSMAAAHFGVTLDRDGTPPGHSLRAEPESNFAKNAANELNHNYSDGFERKVQKIIADGKENNSKKNRRLVAESTSLYRHGLTAQTTGATADAIGLGVQTIGQGMQNHAAVVNSPTTVNAERRGREFTINIVAPHINPVTNKIEYSRIPPTPDVLNALDINIGN